MQNWTLNTQHRTSFQTMTKAALHSRWQSSAHFKNKQTVIRARNAKLNTNKRQIFNQCSLHSFIGCQKVANKSFCFEFVSVCLKSAVRRNLLRFVCETANKASRNFQCRRSKLAFFRCFVSLFTFAFSTLRCAIIAAPSKQQTEKSSILNSRHAKSRPVVWRSLRVVQTTFAANVCLLSNQANRQFLLSAPNFHQSANRISAILQTWFASKNHGRFWCRSITTTSIASKRW